MDDRDKRVSEDGANAAGRVIVDSRGRNVWQWNDEQLDSTSILLRRLDNDALELEPTRRVPIQKPTRANAGRSPSGPLDADIDDTKLAEAMDAAAACSFDPYNSTS